MPPPPFSSSTQSVLNQQRAKKFEREPTSTNSSTHIPPLNHAHLDRSTNNNHRRSMTDQYLREKHKKQERIRKEHLRVQREQQVRRARERAREPLRRDHLHQKHHDKFLQQPADGISQYNLTHRQHHKYQTQQPIHQQHSQNRRRIKQELPEIGIIHQFAAKIKDRFPGRPELARQFLSTMASDRPAEDFLPDVSNMLRRAPELVSEYQTSMGAFDQSRLGQPKQHGESQQPYQPDHPELPELPQLQPQQLLRHLDPNFAARPPTPFSANSVDHDDYNGDDDQDDEPDYSQLGDDDSHPDPLWHLQNAQEHEPHERQAVQHLLRLPEIDIPPEQRKATPVAMSCTLMDHQKVCLSWLMEQEDDPNKRGGILADTMGLGKTVQSLALILAHPSTDPTRKTTLIVAPLALLKQWEREIESKVKPAYKLKTLLYHGADKRGITVAKLLTYDVVLTTYGTIAWEYKAIAEGKRTKKPIILNDDVTFHRVILDEAHHIKTKTGKSSLGTAMIKAKYRLCMTGTPFMNKVGEIYALIRFLRIKPYDEWLRFNWDINKPIENWGGDAGDRAMRKLQTLFRSITLRRTKNSVLDGKPILRLPPLEKKDAMTQFSEDEKAFYLALEHKQQLEVNRFLKKGMIMRQYTYILVLLLRLRQACCHPHLIRDFGIPEGIQASSDDMCKLASKLRKGIVERLKGRDEFECPLCQSTTKNPILIYPCGHPLCSTCFSVLTEVKRPDAEDAHEELTCPHQGCKTKVKSDKVICYCFFLEIHMPERLEADASDSDDSDDDDSEYDDDDEDDVDERGNLKDFIVSGSEDEDDEVDEDETGKGDAEDSENAESDDHSPEDTKSRQPSESKDEALKEAIKKEESVEKDLADDSDSDSLVSLDEIWRRRRVGSIKTKESPAESSKRKITPDSSSDSDEWKPSTRSNGKRKRSTDKQSTGSRKKSKGAAGEKRRKRKTKFMSLGALKKASSTNAAAKAKYLRKLKRDWVPSAKIDKTMEILGDIRQNNPKDKTLIFSLWTSFLDLLEIPVIDQGFKYVRYDGSMDHKNRDKAVKKFMESPDVQVMLVSLSAGNAGLNLAAATHVIIIEPFWNPFVEEQAIDRAHRIGQKNAVTVHRILIEGTVEDRIRDLQEKKRTLVNAALSEEGAQGVGRLTIAELKGLFGIH
ncbi:SNF2 family N-terminal domain-containing protein [Annulohypoxylon truncatum]|uniref:SNF2 family N-terminal domain-containing protein n=1 Tax=Annulohypoxylon truncatum TaxID=327061 RepID=UPI002007D15D|nr:SNF2 family N-terminal domain-containing protein [Annulohypoxylon truncatum]KAI1211110.1 SNF2 family N-terminal domain-containing protein [Annulohypoxylon truncatum]